MKRLLLYSLLVVSAMLTIPCNSPAWGKLRSAEKSNLTVCVMNDVGVGEEEVKKVEERVGGIFAESGVHVRWVQGGDPNRTVDERYACGHPEPYRTLVVRWMSDAKNAPPNELGQTFLDEKGLGVVADVFMTRVARLVGEREANFVALLSYVTAHEIGHLLLGLESHAASGVMRAKINEDALTRMGQGMTEFTNDQQKRMKVHIRSAEVAAMVAETMQARAGR